MSCFDLVIHLNSRLSAMIQQVQPTLYGAISKWRSRATYWEVLNQSLIDSQQLELYPLAYNNITNLTLFSCSLYTKISFVSWHHWSWNSRSIKLESIYRTTTRLEIHKLQQGPWDVVCGLEPLAAAASMVIICTRHKSRVDWYIPALRD
jgi:hypothetical protein